MTTRILLTTTSYQDTPGAHQELLAGQDWEIIRERGPLPESKMLELAGEFDAFLCGDDAITQAVIEKSLPRLKCISKYGIGVDKIDVAFASTQGIPVAYCPGVNHTTVAEHTFGLLLNLTKKIHEVANHTRRGEWKRLTGSEIRGKKLGVIGVGRIGKAIIERAAAFEMECFGFDVHWDLEFSQRHSLTRCSSVDELLASCDVISLNCLLDESTQNLINAESLISIKPGAILLNCARGEIVDSAAVAEALKSGALGGYGADVLETEPPPPDHVLLSAPNAMITSHVGSRTYESVERQAMMATRNLILMLNGKPPEAQVNSFGTAKTSVSNKEAADDSFFVVPVRIHNELVQQAYRHRGYDETESAAATRFCELASRHGIRTHNAIKALHLDHLFGSTVGGCVPGTTIEKLPGRFKASEIWDAKLKLGQAVASDAFDRCIELADEFGIGQVSVDNTFHYLWGGGYVMEAARRGYIAYTNCTSTLAEVVPFKGKFPTLGTNPHSWAFPTTEAIGYPIVIDWATSTVAMGRVQQFKREGRELPPNAAVDADGNPTRDPEQAVSLLPFGAHKGYGLSLINELVAALIGGSLPTLRGRPHDAPDSEKTCTNFYFQIIHPEAMNAGMFAGGRSQIENIQAVIGDILGHGNDAAMLPGQLEFEAAQQSEQAGGLLFTQAEIDSFNEIAAECQSPQWDSSKLERFPAS